MLVTVSEKLNEFLTLPYPWGLQVGETVTSASENGEEVRLLTVLSVFQPPTQFMLHKVYPWKLERKGYEENLQWDIAVAVLHHEDGTTKPKP